MSVAGARGLTSAYLQELGAWLDEVECEVRRSRRDGRGLQSVDELHQAIGAAQAAVARILAERRLLA